MFTTYLYLFDSGTHYVMGASPDPEKRRKAREKASCQRLTTVSVFRGNSQTLKLLRHKFKHLKQTGDWYARDPELEREFTKRGLQAAPLLPLPPVAPAQLHLFEAPTPFRVFTPQTGANPRAESAINQEWWAICSYGYVSNLGRVRNFEGELIKLCTDDTYWFFYHKGTKVYLHRLILFAFEGDQGGWVRCTAGLDVRLCNLSQIRRPTP